MKRGWRVEVWDNYGHREVTLHFLYEPTTYVAQWKATGFQVAVIWYWAWDDDQEKAPGVPS